MGTLFFCHPASRPCPAAAGASCLYPAVFHRSAHAENHQGYHCVFPSKAKERTLGTAAKHRGRTQHQRAAKTAKGGVKIPYRGAHAKTCCQTQGIHPRKQRRRQNNGCRRRECPQRSSRQNKGKEQKCNVLFHGVSPFRGSAAATFVIYALRIHHYLSHKTDKALSFDSAFLFIWFPATLPARQNPRGGCGRCPHFCC